MKCFFELQLDHILSSLPPDPPGQLDILGHDCDTLGVDGAQVCILKQTNQVGLACFLESSNSCTLEPEVGLEILSNLTDQALEGQLADKQLCGLLVSSDLTQSHCARPVPVRFLHSTSRGC